MDVRIGAVSHFSHGEDKLYRQQSLSKRTYKHNTMLQWPPENWNINADHARQIAQSYEALVYKIQT